MDNVPGLARAELELELLLLSLFLGLLACLCRAREQQARRCASGPSPPGAGVVVGGREEIWYELASYGPWYDRGTDGLAWLGWAD